MPPPHHNSNGAEGVATVLRTYSYDLANLRLPQFFRISLFSGYILFVNRKITMQSRTLCHSQRFHRSLTPFELLQGGIITNSKHGGPMTLEQYTMSASDPFYSSVANSLIRC